MNKCKFNISYIGQCKEDVIEKEDFCKKHIDFKCSVCGKQATKDCSRTDILVCGIPLCDDKMCELIHTYRHHFALVNVKNIRDLEDELGVEPCKIVISKVSYENSELNTEEYKMLIVYKYNGKYNFVVRNMPMNVLRYKEVENLNNKTVVEYLNSYKALGDYKFDYYLNESDNKIFIKKSKDRLFDINLLNDYIHIEVK
ncbi:hypothetical protein BFS06_11360 [Clostridium perfringens]|uniref:hypothetical protein n=1 Tax=Clostridium perfringens TaxID=1502 RepID=UPI001038E28D|nr:hypothetical protein [Clostridium perfringens]TBX14812.1 hypothetical protein BFS06_11360 [Clostridium perfringens]